MSERTKDRVQAALLEIVAHIDQPSPDWRQTRRLVGEFVDELQGHMEDEFLADMEREPHR